MKIKLITVLSGLLVLGCAGWSRSCSSGMAESFGADWVVVQYDLAGRPFRCWKLNGASITNEEHSDGVYWVGNGGNLVHISGMYNRIQVENNQWNSAFNEVGLSEEQCKKIQKKHYVLLEEDKASPEPKEDQ